MTRSLTVAGCSPQRPFADLAQHLIALRRATRLPQRVLAEAANISRGAVQRAESGTTAPTPAASTPTCAPAGPARPTGPGPISCVPAAAPHSATSSMSSRRPPPTSSPPSGTSLSPSPRSTNGPVLPPSATPTSPPAARRCRAPPRGGSSTARACRPTPSSW
ncbi:helix-turn-helix domain-containing protein [Streptomyces sp. enrichment culture]|uniref:helix-turn-helix domain-containing protein n=1 Tax=Streptomyces sp. enrichment culture TaxID=1795815 RepID=UPI003F55407C